MMWSWRKLFTFILLLDLVKADEVLSIRTTVTDNNLRYACRERPLTITCRGNVTTSTHPQITVNNDQFFFLRGLETVTRNSFSVALNSFSENRIAIMTVHFSSLGVSEVVTKCLDIAEDQSTVRAAGTPQPPTNVEASVISTTDQSVLIRVTWTTPTTVNYDLDYYLVSVTGANAVHVGGTTTIVEIPKSSNNDIEVAVSIVDECGQQSSSATAMVSETSMVSMAPMVSMASTESIKNDAVARGNTQTTTSYSSVSSESCSTYVVATAVLAALFLLLLVTVLFSLAVMLSVLYRQHKKGEEEEGTYRNGNVCSGSHTKKVQVRSFQSSSAV